MKTKTMTETQTQVSPKPEAKTPWPQQNIPIKDIEIGERLRPLDEKEVEEKVKSVTELSLLNPITVSRHPTRPTIGGDPFPRPRYLLRAGLHRLEACKRLKWKEIPAVIRSTPKPDYRRMTRWARSGHSPAEELIGWPCSVAGRAFEPAIYLIAFCANI